MFISFSNGNGSARMPLTTAWIADNIISFRKRRCAMYKDIAVRNVIAETGRDLVFTATARLSDLSILLTGEVRRWPEPSARPSTAAVREERQVCRTCLFAEGVELCLCFLPSCAMYIDNAVGNVVAETGRNLSVVLKTTARLSDLSMPLKGEVRRSPEQSARKPIARSGKFVRRAYSRRALNCDKATVLCFLSPRSTLLFERSWGKREDLTWQLAVTTPRTTELPIAKPQTATIATATVAQVKQHIIPEQPGSKNSKDWAKLISKKESNYYQKLLEIEKEIVREVVRGDKRNLRKSANCKAQISTMCGVNDTDLCVAICRFSQFVFVASNNFTHNLLFYFQYVLAFISFYEYLQLEYVYMYKSRSFFVSRFSHWKKVVSKVAKNLLTFCNPRSSVPKPHSLSLSVFLSLSPSISLSLSLSYTVYQLLSYNRYLGSLVHSSLRYQSCRSVCQKACTRWSLATSSTTLKSTKIRAPGRMKSEEIWTDHQSRLEQWSSNVVLNQWTLLDGKAEGLS